MSVQESPAEAWVGSGAGLGALDVALRAWDLLKEVTIIFINSTKVGSQVKHISKLMSLLLNTLSRFVIAFLSRSKFF